MPVFREVPHDEITTLLGPGPTRPAQRSEISTLLDPEATRFTQPGEIIQAVMELFPEKQRIFFVHIPKCAGTDFRESLMAHFPVVDANLGDAAWSQQPEVIVYREMLRCQIPSSRVVIGHGHLPVKWYLDRQLIRPGDRMITVVRDPLDVMVSTINHVLYVLSLDTDIKRPDTIEWRRKLGLSDDQISFDPASIQGMTESIIHDTDILGRDPICSFLGDGCAMSAQRRVSELSIEVVDLSNYTPWLLSTFGVQSLRRNQSKNFISRHAMADREAAQLTEITRQDRIFYKMIGQSHV